MAPEEQQTTVDYKEYSYEPFTKYIDVGAWLKSKGLDWSAIDTVAGSLIFVDYPDTAGTLIDIRSVGFLVNTI